MKVLIVNDNDEIIGAKERDEVADTDIYRVAALWLTNSKGESLIAQRAMTKTHGPGQWAAAVAGTVEEGETYETNIYKEAMEEIGLRGVTFQKSKKVRIKDPRNYFCQWYVATVDRDITEFTRQISEVDAIKWVTVDQIRRELQETPDMYVLSMTSTLTELNL